MVALEGFEPVSLNGLFGIGPTHSESPQEACNDEKLDQHAGEWQYLRTKTTMSTSPGPISNSTLDGLEKMGDLPRHIELSNGQSKGHPM